MAEPTVPSDSIFRTLPENRCILEKAAIDNDSQGPLYRTMRIHREKKIFILKERHLL